MAALHRSEEFIRMDLATTCDEAMLDRVYSELLLPSFSRFRDELEDVSVPKEQLRVQRDSIGLTRYRLHIVVLLHNASIVGSVFGEFYPKSKCGLITYMVVHPGFRNLGASHLLMDGIIETLHQECNVLFTDMSSCAAIFLETNDASKIEKEHDIMDPLIRYRILARLGFHKLELEYIQPALSDLQTECTELVLAAHSTSLYGDGVPSSILSAFIAEYWTVLHSNPESNQAFQHMMNAMQSTSSIAAHPFIVS